MANTYLSLESVSFGLPNGETLFSELNENFDQRHTGLVGRNGCGKTMLALILAGLLEPSSGRCIQTGRVHYLAQQVCMRNDTTVADLAGVQNVLDAVKRIEAGSCAQADFNTIGENWFIESKLQQALELQGLKHLNASTPSSMLSGGESMRVALIGAQLSEADFLILDEPSNHLDDEARQRLIEWLKHWKRGLLVISHDRELLMSMERIVELSSLGLRSYGGNYALYAQAKTQAQKSALAELDNMKLERQRAVQVMRVQRERQEKRLARGNSSRKKANQAKILMDRQKERSEQSIGKLRTQQAGTQLVLAQRVREAALQVGDEQHIHAHPVNVDAVQKRIAELENVILPFVPEATQRINLVVTGQQRIGVQGPNGCGKSTLLKVLASQIAPLAGDVKVTPSIAYFDQGLASLDAQHSVLEQLQVISQRLSESDLRMRLAQLGLDAHKINAPSGALSGGERLKAALACVFYADEPPQLLMLDEPSNHLDLPSMQALEKLLSLYQGALFVVSHDKVFLGQLGLTDWLVASSGGWKLLPAEQRVKDGI